MINPLNNQTTASELNKLYVVGTTRASLSFPINIPNPAIQYCSQSLSGQKDGFLSEFDISSLIGIEEVVTSKTLIKND